MIPKEFQEFPSREWFLIHCESPLLERLAMAIVITFLRNVLLYVYGMPRTYSDVEIAHVMRKSNNPLRWLRGVPMVFSYKRAVEKVSSQTLEERLDMTRKYYFETIIINTALELQRKLEVAPRSLHTQLICSGDCIRFRQPNGRYKKIHNPELAEELRLCVYNGIVVNQYRIYTVNNRVIMGTVRLPKRKRESRHKAKSRFIDF